MTYRAVEVLNDVDIIYAEDTRTSRVLLNHYDIKTPLYSYHKFNEKKRCDEMIDKLNNGMSIAIISDAGSPGISDPSNIIVIEAIRHQLTICPLPGATALIPALTGSGFNSDKFTMIGFLPSKKSERQRLLDSLLSHPYPVIFYESPHHLLDTLNLLFEQFGDREVCIARELTKMFETWYRHNLSVFLENPQSIVLKGEFVIVMNKSDCAVEYSVEKIMAHAELLKNTMSMSEISKQIARDTGLHKKEIYDILLENQLK